MRRLLFAAAILATVLPRGLAQDTTRPGLGFERWVRDTFFAGHRPAGAAQRWDVPASANRAHGGVPVVLKTAPSGAAIDLGDAFRHYEIDEPFLLIVGFWQQVGDEKPIVGIVARVLSAGQWRKLWGPVTYADLQRFDALIKDPAPALAEIRKRALQVKNAPPFADAIIQVNPRIDDRGHRRLQCSLRHRDLFAHLLPGTDPAPPERPALFGIEYPGALPAKSAAPNQD